MAEEPNVFHPMLRTVEIVMFAERAGQERRNVIHYRYDNARPTAAELLNLVNDVDQAIIDQYEDFVCAGTRWYQITARDMETVDGAVAAKQINRLAIGGSQVAPSNVSLCITKRTARAGASFRGRFYIMDCPEDMFNGDDLNPGYLPAITDLAGQMLLARQNGRFIPSVGSRKLQGSTPITSITWDMVADSQRRRLKGRGK